MNYRPDKIHQNYSYQRDDRNPKEHNDHCNQTAFALWCVSYNSLGSASLTQINEIHDPAYRKTDKEVQEQG
jgi:hypothetical protein